MGCVRLGITVQLARHCQPLARQGLSTSSLARNLFLNVTRALPVSIVARTVFMHLLAAAQAVITARVATGYQIPTHALLVSTALPVVPPR